MDKIIIAEMGVEGGGCTVYGRQTDGVWSFWQAGSSMDLDENDDEIWRQWSSEPVPELFVALRDYWWMMHIYNVHPEFVSQLRQAHAQYRGKQGWREWQID